MKNLTVLKLKKIRTKRGFILIHYKKKLTIKKRLKCEFQHFRRFGGERGIRTPGGFHLNGFQDRRNRPLCHLSAAKIQKIIYDSSYFNFFLYFFHYFSKGYAGIGTKTLVANSLSNIYNPYPLSPIIFKASIIPVAFSSSSTCSSIYHFNMD